MLVANHRDVGGSVVCLVCAFHSDLGLIPVICSC
jgi:hypothetical protein